MSNNTNERVTNRILLSMTFGFLALIIMYYLYHALLSNFFTPMATFWIFCGVFIVCMGIMLWKYFEVARKFNLGAIDAYVKNERARMFANFALFFIICAVISLVMLYVGFRTVMPVVAWGIGIYIVALIIGSSIYSAILEKKKKASKISSKAAAKAAKAKK